MLARVRGWTATCILTDSATLLRLTAARTTSTASATPFTPLPTLTPRVSTSTDCITNRFAIIPTHVRITILTDSVTIRNDTDTDTGAVQEFLILILAGAISIVFNF